MALAEEFKPRQKQWTVGQALNNAWIVTSTEAFSGTKNSTNGNKFTAISHVGSRVIPDENIWTRTEYNKGPLGSSSTWVQVAGWVTRPAGNAIRVDKTQEFPFSAVFP